MSDQPSERDKKMLRGAEKMLQTQGTASENEVSLPIGEFPKEILNVSDPRIPFAPGV